MKVYIGVVRKSGVIFQVIDKEEVYALESRQAAIDYGIDLMKKSNGFRTWRGKLFVEDLEKDGYAIVDLSTDYYIHEVELRKETGK